VSPDGDPGQRGGAAAPAAPVAYLLTLLGALALSGTPIMFTLSETHPTVAALWRMLYALPLLLPLCLAQPAARRALQRRAWLPMAALSGAFFAGDLGLWHHAIGVIGAGPATLICNTQPIWVPLFGLAFLGERPTLAFWIALPAAALGMYLLVGGTAAGLPGASDLYGLALALAAGLSYSGMLICLRRASHQGGDVPQALLLVQAPVAIVLLSALGFAEGSLPVSLRAEQHLWLALMGIGAQTLAWSAITYGLARLPSHHGAMILVLQPVGSLVLAWLMLEQALTLGRVAGAVLVLAAIAATVLGDRLPGLRLAADAQATRATTT